MRLILPLLLFTCACHAATNDILINNFESDSFGAWITEGNAFGSGPTAGAVPNQKGIKALEGKRLANSGAGGDSATGELKSPDFKIERHYLRFLIGGAEALGKTSVNLVVDGKSVRTATGLKAKNGRAELLRYEDWDVSDLTGKTAHLEIIDRATNNAGHILADDFLQTDDALKIPSFSLPVKKHYLLLPVKNRARMVPLQIFVDGEKVREFEIELAVGATPDWRAFSDLSSFQGKTIEIKSSDKLPAEIADQIPGLLQQSDEAVETKGLYHEKERPQFHYTVRRGYNNDPNGLVFFNGQYHMFYQNNPYGTDWGNMHWGHAVSPDLVHWTELSPAIYPRGITEGAFSGGATVDHGNKMGFGTGTEDVLLAAYAGIGRGECIAFGTGEALSLKDIPQNPVLKHSGWDPNIMWNEQTKKWLMVVFEKVLPAYGYAFYESTDLISWHRLGLVEGFQDCPDFFELPVEGESTKKWVLYGSKKEANSRYASRSSYMIGTFDGANFKPETTIIEGDAGPAFYAGQTFKNMPDGRRVMIAWLSGASFPGMPFSQGMTIPMDLKLHRVPNGLRLAFTPAREVDQLHGKEFAAGKDLTAVAANTLLKQVNGEFLDCELDLTTDPSDKIKFSVRGMDIIYDAATGGLSCKDAKASVPSSDGNHLKLRVLVDRGVLEIFANDGLAAMAFGGPIFSKGEALELEAAPETKINSLRVTEMKSIWNNP
jgi:fructan beta-fructosidase